MLISPTEPASLRALGKTSSIPERYGCDYILLGKSLGQVGIQRKEISDLVASIYDGRLSKELDQMQSLGQGILLVEGKAQWTNDGLLMNRTTFSVTQYHGVLWSVQSRGYWVNTVPSLNGSIEYLSMLSRWVLKDRHTSLKGRPKARSVWGTANDRDWGIHFLQGLPGIGYDTAASIYDACGGVPLLWRIRPSEMEKIKGLGEKRVAKLIELLDWIEVRGDSS